MEIKKFSIPEKLHQSIYLVILQPPVEKETVLAEKNFKSKLSKWLKSIKNAKSETFLDSFFPKTI